MAKLLYDYWFVQFDFPNEEGKPYKSSGGEMVWNEKLKRDIPAPWETKTIEDIADVYNGATPSTVNEQNYGGDIVWITPKDLSDQKQKFVYQGERNISQAGYNSCSTHLLPLNTVLMSSRAPIGLLSIAKTELCTNQGFKSFVPKAENISTYLYYYLNIHIKQIKQLGTGTTFKEVSREDVLKFPILKPSDAILDLWEERVSALNNKQLEIQKENEYLTKQRDELLPLLMNGQVSVNYDLSARRRVFSASPCTSYLCHITNFVFPMAKELTDIIKAAAEVRSAPFSTDKSSSLINPKSTQPIFYPLKGVEMRRRRKKGEKLIC